MNRKLLSPRGMHAFLFFFFLIPAYHALSQSGSALWTWESGYPGYHGQPIYGTIGVSGPANTPGVREDAVSWTDASGVLWLFGGYGLDADGSEGYLNDLWKYDGTNWAWVSGSNVANATGTYGTQGIAALTNIPGARNRAISYVDALGVLWLFGGSGFDADGSEGYLNDLWKYDGTNWAWISGSNTINAIGNYGTQGTAASTNTPGARDGAVSWTDASGALWLFGGDGRDVDGNLGYLNDLWKYDGTNWTWVSGSNTRDATGTYGNSGHSRSH